MEPAVLDDIIERLLAVKARLGKQVCDDNRKWVSPDCDLGLQWVSKKEFFFPKAYS